MKKIYLSILSIVATIGIVSGAAYALFSDTVKVSGLTVSTSNADLQINVMDENVDANYTDSIDVTSLVSIPNLYPGFQAEERFYLRNISKGSFYLRPSLQLTSAGGNWSTLKDTIEINITDLGTDGNGTYSWGWRTLAWWNSEAKTISQTPGLDIGNDKAHQYKIEVRVPTTADNTIAGKTLSNVTFVITGTQVNL